MSNALHDYAKLFEKYAARNGGTGVILAGEDCLSLANEMRMDADAIDAENAKLRKILDIASDMARDYDGDRRLLRRLVQDMWLQLLNAYGYKEVNDFADRMRELGVEVDG